MRKTENKGLMIRKSSTSAHAVRFAAVAVGIGLLMASGVARAQDADEEDDKTFEERHVDARFHNTCSYLRVEGLRLGTADVS